jgi:hypothetical protein
MTSSRTAVTVWQAGGNRDEVSIVRRIGSARNDPNSLPPPPAGKCPRGEEAAIGRATRQASVPARSASSVARSRSGSLGAQGAVIDGVKGGAGRGRSPPRGP